MQKKALNFFLHLIYYGTEFAVLWTAFHAAGEKAGPPDVLCETFGMAGLPQVQLLSYANNSKRIAVFACYF